MYGNRHNKDISTNTSAIAYTETEDLPYSDKQLFKLISDVERYPEFLPGWLLVKVKSRNETSIIAHQKIGIPLFYWEFDSKAILDEPRSVKVSAEDGPFHYLDIHWYLEPLTQKKTRLTINVKADIVRHARLVLNEVIEKSVHSLLEHFSERAREIYGSRD